jgi:hypothetical protein
MITKYYSDARVADFFDQLSVRGMFSGGYLFEQWIERKPAWTSVRNIFR